MTMSSARAVLSSSKNPRSVSNLLGFGRLGTIISRRLGNGVEGGDNGTPLNRDFLVQLWVADAEMRSSGENRKRNVQKYKFHSEPVFQHPFERWFSGGPDGDQNSVKDSVEPTSVYEARTATILARSNLLITRDIEWANIAIGFEQGRFHANRFVKHHENRYAIIDVSNPKLPVGYIREQSNVIARQLLCQRRPFVAHITDGMDNELFMIRRPFWWINSSIYVLFSGEEIGVVHRRGHLWKRIYDLYLGNKQFAVVENPGLWNWTFTLKDIDGKVLAEIDRNWRGFGFELLTDAGQYAIRFGSADPIFKTDQAGIEELEVAHPLSLSERAVTLALAVSLDNDYFSRHGGWGLPFLTAEESDFSSAEI